MIFFATAVEKNLSGLFLRLRDAFQKVQL